MKKIKNSFTLPACRPAKKIFHDDGRPSLKTLPPPPLHPVLLPYAGAGIVYTSSYLWLFFLQQ
jgi:hypothetical protein